MQWIEGEAYVWVNGMMVLTRAYLLSRGYCCGSGCKNCPYGYEKVPEPLKSQLLKAQHEAQPR